MSRTERRIYVWWFVLWGAATLALYAHINLFGGIDDEFRGLSHVWHPYWFNVVYAVFGLPPAAWATRRAWQRFGNSELGRTVLLLAVAYLGWVAGNLIWFWYNTCTFWPAFGCAKQVTAPYPSIADVAYASWLLFALLSMVSLGRALGIRRGDVLRLWWVYAIVLFGTAWVGMTEQFTVAGIAFGRGWLVSAEYSGPATAFSIAYALGHVAVLSAAIVVARVARRAWGGVLAAPMVILLVAVTLMYLAELAFFRSLAEGSFQNAQPEEGLYALVLLLVPISLYRFATVALPAGASLSTPITGSAADQLATSIVAAHARLLGSVALELARRVDGVDVRASDGTVEVTGPDADVAIDGIVRTFEQVSGAFGLEVSRLAAAHVLREHPELAVPTTLRA
jgi:hypothetical protein